jgi:hypothetical protein
VSLKLEENADRLPVAHSAEPKAARLEVLMIEPGPHAAHLAVQIVFDDWGFHDIEHYDLPLSQLIGNDHTERGREVSATYVADTASSSSVAQVLRADKAESGFVLLLG